MGLSWSHRNGSRDGNPVPLRVIDPRQTLEEGIPLSFFEEPAFCSHPTFTALLTSTHTNTKHSQAHAGGPPMAHVRHHREWGDARKINTWHGSTEWRKPTNEPGNRKRSPEDITGEMPKATGELLLCQRSTVPLPVGMMARRGKSTQQELASCYSSQTHRSFINERKRKGALILRYSNWVTCDHDHMAHSRHTSHPQLAPCLTGVWYPQTSFTCTAAPIRLSEVVATVDINTVRE